MIIGIIIASVVFLVVVIVLSVYAELGDATCSLLALLAIVAVFAVGEFAFYLGKDNCVNKLAQEVNMSQVPAKGNLDFTCSVRGHYKDGVVKGAELVKGSTVLTLVVKPVEKPTSKKILEPLE